MIVSKLETKLLSSKTKNYSGKLLCASILHKLNTGLDEETKKTLKVLMGYNKNGKAIVEQFKNISNIADYLEQNICGSIPFIVYYEKNFQDLRREKLLDDLREKFLDVIIDLKKYIKNIKGSKDTGSGGEEKCV